MKAAEDTGLPDTSFETSPPILGSIGRGLDVFEVLALHGRVHRRHIVDVKGWVVRAVVV